MVKCLNRDVRRLTDHHLILLATCEVLGAAAARLPGVATLGPIGFFGVVDLFVGVIAV